MKATNKFIIGLIAGLLLGSASTALAQAIVESGYAFGWVVLSYHGQPICYEPYVHFREQQIRCGP
jgi:hypothetical protein